MSVFMHRYLVGVLALLGLLVLASLLYLVLGKRSEWLFHLSAMPTVVVYNHNKLLINNEHIHAKHVRINMIFNERAAIVYHFSPRYHAGISMMMSNSLFDDKAVKVNQNKLLARAFFGFRL